LKIAAISDTHGYPFDLLKAEVLVHAGDLTANGLWQEAVLWGERINTTAYAGVVLVPGNHDLCFEQMPQQEFYNFPPDFHLLIDKAWEYKGRVFYGSPWTPPFMNWAFMRSESELRRIYRKMPVEVDILITHGPACGIFDNECGSRALRDAIEARKIHCHIFGHIHEYGGSSGVFFQQGNKTHCFNVAALGADYKPPPRKPRLIEIE
jgi:Icc-related predicted phosphoesterase